MDIFVVTIIITGNKDSNYNCTNNVIFLDREKAINFITDAYNSHIESNDIRERYKCDEEQWECEIAHVLYNDGSKVSWKLTQYGYYKDGAYVPMKTIQEMFEDMITDDAISEGKSSYL